MSLFEELKRRNVFRVAIGYVAVAWLVAQVVDLVLENFGVSPWIMRSLLVALAAGLPISLVFAWAFEITPEGIKREQDAANDTAQRKPNRKLGRMIVLAGVLVVSWYLFETLFLERQKAEMSAASKSGQMDHTGFGAEAGLSIAVLPFVNMSSDAENEYFSDGITEELLNVLVKINTLRVASRTSSFTFKGKDLPIPQIAQELMVNHVLEGSVRKSGNRVRITAQLIEARSDKHLWSETFDRDLDDIFEIQNEISNSIVDALKIVLNVDEMAAVTLAQRPTSDTQAYELYLQGRHLWRKRQQDNIRASMRLFEQAIEIDPYYARAYLALASAWAVLPSWSFVPLSEAMEKASVYAEQALEMDATLAEATTILAQAAANEHRWADSMDLYKKAIWSEPRNPSLYQWFSEHLLSLGYIKEALDQMMMAYALDPSSPVVNVSLIWVAQMNHEDDLAYRHAENAQRLELGNKAEGSLFFARGRRGEAVELKEYLVTQGAPPIMDTCVDALVDPAEIPRLAIEMAKFAHNFDGRQSLDRLQWCRALAGDAEAAAKHLGEYADNNWTLIHNYWDSNPGSAAMRQTMAFKETLGRLGLVDFYRKNDWPDVCRPLGEEDFECD